MKTLRLTRLPIISLPWVFVCLQYDNRADNLTKEGMLNGIEQAAAFILFLSVGVLDRPYCQLEIRHAMALKKPIVLLHGERLVAALVRTAGCARALCV